MNLRSLSTVALILIPFVAFFGTVGAGQSQEACPTPVSSDSQQFQGTTATVTEPFTVQSGILKVIGRYEGSGNFAVIAYSETDYEDLIFNEIGSYTGQSALQVEPGTTLVLDVEADGPWEITIEPAFRNG